MRTVHSLGRNQYAKYTKSIHKPIKKNALPLFSRPKSKKKTAKISLLKDDVSLFSHLCIVMQHRSSDMSNFFSHENHSFPLIVESCG